MAVPMVRYKGLPKPHSWSRWMVGRVMRKNANNLFSIIGKVGSGKTYAGLSQAEIMSKMSGVPFKIDFVVFSLTELMTEINKKPPRGTTFLFDEPQASISSKDFQQQANKVFNLLVSTFRHRNYSLIFCCPFESMLDKSTRMLFHARMETLSINPEKKTCRLKPRFLEYSDFKSEPYRKQLIVSFKNKAGLNKTEKLFYWDVPLPSKELIDAYEIKKLAFTTNLNKNIMAKLEEFDMSGKSMTAEFSNEPPKRKPLTESQQQVMECLAHHTFKEAIKILGIASGSISQSKELALKKGYTLEEFREDIQ